jgi:AraC family transcriptional regulator
MGSLRSQTLLETPSAVVARFDHGTGPVLAGVEEDVCDHYCINFVDSGEFGLGVGNRLWRLGRGGAFAWHPGAVHRYIHFDGMAGDTCLTVRFRDGAEREIEREGWLAETARIPVFRPGNRIAFLRLQLDRILQLRSQAALDSWTAELLEAAARPQPPHRLYGDLQLRRHAARVELARERILVHPDEPHTLASLASSVGMSPFHFARVFRTLIGVPPHRFLRDVRLDRARSMLLDGESVTTTCYAAGFGNLSHFIRSFRRRFGTAPSLLRKKAQAGGSFDVA